MTHTQMLWMWLFFILGQGVYVLKRAAMAIRGANAIQSRRQYLTLMWDILLIRFAIEAGIFWVWLTWPDGWNKILATFGWSVNWSIPVIPPVAFGFGLALDAMLDWAATKTPWLSRELPSAPVQLPGPVPGPGPAPSPTVK